jgi:uncharacterized coiled-coil protein SlyX
MNLKEQYTKETGLNSEVKHVCSVKGNSHLDVSGSYVAWLEKQINVLTDKVSSKNIAINMAHETYEKILNARSIALENQVAAQVKIINQINLENAQLKQDKHNLVHTLMLANALTKV